MTTRSRRPRRPSSRRPAAIPSLVITLVHASLILQLTSSTSSRRFSCEAAAAAAAAPQQHVSWSTVVLQPSQVAQIRATSSSNSIRRIAFVAAPRYSLPDQFLPESLLLGLRGGDDGTADDSDDDDDESDQDDSDEEEEAEVESAKEAAPPAAKEGLDDASLSASAVRSAIKTKVKREIAKKQAAKRAMSDELKSVPVESSSKKLKTAKSSSSVSFFRVPYVIRAFLNPVTVFRMTIAYWASLFDLDYMKRREAPASQDLRSALQEKSRYEPSKKKGSGGSKKQMKRGQAKTLSDLPQLSS
jgi:hypothetical protein